MTAPAGMPGGAEIVLLTGISGSGKSVALHALEDAGYFCVDNLPPELLRDFIRLEQARFTSRVAVAVDVRTAQSLPQLLPLVAQLRDEGLQVRMLFLDASTEALVRRFSETRRPHPLTAAHVPGAAGLADGLASAAGATWGANSAHQARAAQAACLCSTATNRASRLTASSSSVQPIASWRSVSRNIAMG